MSAEMACVDHERETGERTLPKEWNALLASGPAGFLVRRAALRIAAAARFRDAAGPALDAAMKAAIDDLPRVWIKPTRTEQALAQTERWAVAFADACREAREDLAGARVENDLALLEELSHRRGA